MEVFYFGIAENTSREVRKQHKEWKATNKECVDKLITAVVIEPNHVGKHRNNMENTS